VSGHAAVVEDALKVKEVEDPFNKNQLGKKKKFIRRDTNFKNFKEGKRSISRAREDHKRNLNEISKINDSVKYSPVRPSDSNTKRNIDFEDANCPD